MPNTSTKYHERSKQQLRRAVYNHVSDLTSAYNVDHEKIESEFARVNMERENPAAAALELFDSLRLSSVPSEFETGRLHPPRGGFNLCW